MILGLASIGIFSTWFFETFNVGVLDFFFISAVLNGFAMAVWIPLVLYCNMKFLPKSAHPHPFNIFVMLLATLFYLSFAGYTIWEKVSAFFDL